MLANIGKLILGKLLANETMKAAVFKALREAAKRTDNTLDDSAVDVIQVIWDVVVPILTQK